MNKPTQPATQRRSAAEKIDEILAETKQQTADLDEIKRDYAEIKEILTIWRHGKGAFWAVWGLGKVITWAGAITGALAAITYYYRNR